MKRVKNHPGKILLREFILPQFADESNIDLWILERIVDEVDRVDEALATKLADYLGTSPEYWTNLQEAHIDSFLPSKK